ncbi:hypothetical protein [Aliiroseovarius subalbicans]|uniref:hypothetical protein n=1 Tax=Aliiroseovarius subalbicans TaxID=2925840 RepID=UPI001F564F9B|nr:hypothetical protein [Aliiroseovarius subalbicans]MCI2399300.1 hypothetical protein [Aliiroseovarius subalbicans]
MTLSDLFHALIVLVPVGLAWRGAQLWTLMASVAGLYLGTAALSRLLLTLAPQLFAVGGTDPALQDSYYVAAPPGTWTTALVWGLLALATRALAQRNALLYPRLACGLFWGLLVAQVSGWVLPRLWMAQVTSLDPETLVERFTPLNGTAMALGIVAFVALAGLITLLAASAISLFRTER